MTTATLSHPSSGARSGAVLLPLGYTVLIAVLIAPLFTAAVPPLLDYPNHLARAHILATIADDPLLREFYTVRYRPLPNLAGDLVIPAVARLVGIHAAGKMFLALCLVVPVVGAAVLNRVLFGAWHWWPMASGFFVYHGAFIAGFMNFSLGLGLALLAAAGWIAATRKHWAARLALGAGFAILLYFTHLFAVGFYGLMIGSHTLVAFLRTPAEARWRRRSLAEWLLLAVPFVPPAVLLLSMGQGGGEVSVLWAIAAKLRGLVMPVLNHDLTLDVFTVFALTVAAVALLALRRLRLEGSMAPALIAAVAMLVLLPAYIVVAPPDTSTTQKDFVAIAERFPILIFPLLAAATRPAIGHKAFAWFAGLAFLALFAVRHAVLTATWMEFDRYIAEVRAAMRVVEPGATVDSVIPYKDLKRTYGRKKPPPPRWAYTRVKTPNLFHVATIAVIDRSAFVPTLFKDPTKHPLAFTGTYKSFDKRRIPLSVKDAVEQKSDGTVALRPAAAKVDYLLVLYAEIWTDRALLKAPGVEIAYRGRRIMLLRLPKARPAR